MTNDFSGQRPWCNPNTGGCSCSPSPMCVPPEPHCHIENGQHHHQEACKDPAAPDTLALFSLQPACTLGKRIPRGVLQPAVSGCWCHLDAGRRQLESHLDDGVKQQLFVLQVACVSAAEVLPEVVCTSAKTFKYPGEGLGHMGQAGSLCAWAAWASLMIACASHREEAEACALRLPESTSGSPPAWLQTRYARVHEGLLRIAMQADAHHGCCQTGPSAFSTVTQAKFGNRPCRIGLFCSCSEHVEQAENRVAATLEGVALDRQVGHWLGR